MGKTNLINSIDGNNISLRGVAGVLRQDVIDGRLSPIDVDGAPVDLPDKQRGAGQIQMHGEGVVGLLDEAVDGHGPLHDGGKVGQIQALMIDGSDTAVGGEPAGSAGVMEDGCRSGVERAAAERLSAEGDVEPVVAGAFVGVDRDVVPLTDGEEEAVDRLRVDRDHVGRDDRHGVVLEVDLEVVLGRGVDDAEAMPLAGSQSDVGPLSGAGDGVLSETLEEDVVAEGRTGVLGDFDKLIGGFVVVVREGEGTEVDIVGKRSRAVDYDGADDAVAVLGGEVRVIPACAVLLGAELVDSRTSLRRNGALGDAVGTVMQVGFLLVEAMPVD